MAYETSEAKLQNLAQRGLSRPAGEGENPSNRQNLTSFSMQLLCNSQFLGRVAEPGLRHSTRNRTWGNSHRGFDWHAMFNGI